MPLLDARRETNALIALVNQQYLQESPRFLLTGCILGTSGFLLALIPYILRVITHIWDNTDIPFDEDPPTVSELVSKWETVEARIFFGFQLAAAFCILLSWYPFKLRYACCIPASGGCQLTFCCCHIHWATLRQFLPPIGLLLVACCPTVSMDEGITLAQCVLLTVHTVAGVMMFVGFILCEAHALSVKLFHVTCERGCPKLTWSTCRVPTIDPGTVPYRLRYITWNMSAFFSLAFCAIESFCDVRGVHTWRILSFTSEVFAGLAMLGNMTIIWYYSPERLWSRRGVVGDWSQAAVQPVSSANNAPIPEIYASTLPSARLSARPSTLEPTPEEPQAGIELPSSWTVISGCAVTPHLGVN